MTIKSVSNHERNQIRRALNRNTNPVITGDVNGNVSYQDMPTSGLVWARRQQADGTYGAPFLVRGSQIPGTNTPGIPVELSVDRNRQQRVEGIDVAGAQVIGFNPTQFSTTDPNANNSAFVNQQFITTAYAQVVEGTLKVGIRGWIVFSAGTFYKVEGQVDFTGNIPSAGNHGLAVIASLNDYSGFEVQYSTPKNTGVPLDLTDVQEAWDLMSAPTTNIPMWAFSIGDGQTTLTDTDRWLDLRNMINIGGGGTGSAAFTFTAKTANYAMTVTDTGIALDATSGNVTITLPDATLATGLRAVKRVDSSSNAALVNTTGGQTIDGVASVAFGKQWQGYIFAPNGTNWRIVASYLPGPGSSTDRALVTWDGVLGGGLFDNANTNVDSSGNLTVNAYKLPTAQAATLSSDAFTATKGYVIITSQTGTTDNLATINGGSGNTLIVIQAAASNTITVKNGTGNIFLNGGADVALSGDKTLALFYDGTNWADLGAGGSGGSGTVTNVSWATGDGVSAVITNPTTTPAITPALGAITPDSAKAKGTAGAGFFEDVAQSANPSAPAATGWRAFATSIGHFAWRIKNGSDTFVRSFIGVLTADRAYTWPDYDGTVATTAGTETFTNKTLTSPVISGGTIDNATVGATTPATGCFSSVLVGASLDASAIAQFDSTTKGFVGPRMTTTQRLAISSPLNGLEVYDTTLSQQFQYQGGAWVAFGTAGAGSLSVTDGTNTVAGTTSLSITGATVGGTSPNATLTVNGANTRGNVVANPSLEDWPAGTSSAPTPWVLTGASATVAREATIVKHGLYSAKLTRVGTDCNLMEDMYIALGSIFVRSRQYTIGAWVYATVASRVRLRADDGVTVSNSSYHSGGSSWEWITLTYTPGAAVTQFKIGLQVDTGNTSGYIDAVAVVEGSTISSGYYPQIAPVQEYICIQDQKTATTNGGAFTQGAWRTRDLNTITADTTGAVTVSSNQFTLPAGTYRIRASAPALRVYHHQIRLQNITDSATTLTGTTCYSDQINFYAQDRSEVVGRFTITSSKTFEIQHQCQSTQAGTFGMGTASGFTTEVYTIVELIKE